MKNISKAHDHHHDHDHSLLSELICHFPYAVFAVAFGLSLLSLMTYISCTLDSVTVKKGSHIMFHSFHFMHIVFAATGTLITFFRFSQNWVKGLLVGLISPSLFCMLSDSILPYIGGRLLGVHMHFHLCFISDLHNVLPFLFLGVINGFLMGKFHTGDKGLYSIFSHAIHIVVSSLASIFYLVSHGFVTWYEQIGYVFLFLVVAVVIPCTFSDVVVPIMFARNGKE